MSDERVRALLRRWQASGSPAAALEYLLAAVRTGAVTRDRLELAAYLAYEPARAVAAGLDGLDPAILTAADETDVRGFVRGLLRWGPGVVVRCAAAIARRGLEWGLRPRVDLEAAGLGPALRTVEAWAACPCPDHLREVQDTQRATRGAEGAPWAPWHLLDDLATAADPSSVGGLPVRVVGRELATTGDVVVEHAARAILTACRLFVRGLPCTATQAIEGALAVLHRDVVPGVLAPDVGGGP